MPRGLLTFVLLAFLLTSNASAIESRPAADGRQVEPSVAMVRAEPLDPASDGPAGGGARQFLLRRGGQWRFAVDPRTGLATLVQGSGIPLIPGRGNALERDSLLGLSLPDGDVTLEALEPLIRAFIEQNRDLLGPANGTLELEEETSGPRDDGRLWSFYYRWLIGGVPVEGARVFVRINNGNITQFGAPLVGPADVDTSPVIDAAGAVELLLEWSGDDEVARFLGEPQLILQPEDSPAGLDYRLVWTARYRIRGQIETWEGRIDARTGEIVGFRDVNAYGSAKGGVYPRTVTDTEVTVAMPFSTVTGETTVAADVAGNFTYAGGTISSGLDGQFFRTACEACSGPAQAEASVALGSGRLDFGLGGLDGVANGFSTPAERNAYYHLNQIRLVVKKWLSIPWLESNIGINVNIQDTCNAVWTGEANFFRSGDGCNNTGEISDVMYHEWGHGLDGNTRGGDGATGEGTADVVSMHVTRSPLVGPYFRTTGSPVRNIDSTTSSRGFLSVANIASKCSTAGSTGPLGYEVHCEGEIYGQTAWDFSQALTAKHGHHTGWRASERIFFNSLADAGSYLSTGSFPIYDAYVNADDDNGNLADGTPNGQEIFDAFDAHGIAGSAVTSSTTCTRPTQPTVLATPDCDRVTLSWSAVPGVDHYEVARSEMIEDRATYHVADVAASETGYTDLDVAPGVDYYYVVMAVAPDGCESNVEAPVLARLVSQPVLDVTAASYSDDPQGNRSGFPDPGEDVDLSVTLRNVGDADAFTISGALTSPTPGVTIVQGSDTWSDLATGAASGNQDVLRFSTDDQQLGCGDTVRFRLAPGDSSSCVSEDSFFDVRLGDLVVQAQDDFETDQGWTVDLVNSTATAGAWTRGDPDGTTFQPELDVSDPGTQCFFTASNGGGLGTDDVDGGVTILVSPIFDLSGLDSAILSYWRWFANRDLGEDSGDFFMVDVTDGGEWVNLETLGTHESAASWTRREFKLEDFVSLNSQIQIRFQASDGPATGNLIEAAVDLVTIQEPVCDDTPACFTEPTFAGVDTAQPGASCGENQLAWSAATSNCVNAELTYNVYRSTDPGFIPGAGNLVASGLTGTSFTDTLLDPGAAYHYVVRAFDSRSGEDSNVTAVSVTAPASPDLASPIFAGIDSALSGVNCGEVVLGWSQALESCNVPVAYEVHRSTDPGFTPDASSLVGSTLSLAFVDAALAPGSSYTYVVRARDEQGNVDANGVRFTVDAALVDLVVTTVDFEADNGAWSVVSPNDAVSGNWEWGNPSGTGIQPEDDHTPGPGVNAWITGLSTGGGDGGNDLDDGTTTLESDVYDLSSAVDPVVRYARWFTNDQGSSPGLDTFDIEVASNGGGTNWALLEQVSGGTPLEWVEVEIPLTSATSNMRFRFTARDLLPGSLVEAGIDDFELIDLGQGCAGCPTPVTTVGTVAISRSGANVILDWTSDPVSGTRYVVYKLSGPTYADAVAIGTTDSRIFIHEGAATSGEDFFYRVTAVDACANESDL
jgi:hypothetical protein